MSKLSEKQLLILTIAVTVLLTGGLTFLIWSDLKAVEEEEATIASLHTQIGSAEREIALIPSREHQVIADREISEKEVAFLPEATEIEQFWEVLERYAGDSGVRISRIAPNTTRTATKDAGSIAQVPQVMSLRATVDEFLRFINLLENHDRIITVLEYSISQGEHADEDGKVRHGIRLALTTFTYNRKIANTIVSIPNYDKKKGHPEVKKALSRIKIQEKQTYTLRTSLARRDPFLNVRRARPKAGNDDVRDREAQEALLENLVQMNLTITEGLDVEDHLRKIGDLFRLAQQVKENRDLFNQLQIQISQIERDGLISDGELLNRFRLEVVEPFALTKERLGKVEDHPKLIASQVKEIRDRIAKLFDERSWKKVDDEVRAFMELSRNGEWVEDDAKELAFEIANFKRSADIIQKFEKRKIDISTILYSPNTGSVAVVNGKQLSVGDALDADGQVTIAEIGENFVIFVTEGVEIKRMQGK